MVERYNESKLGIYRSAIRRMQMPFIGWIFAIAETRGPGRLREFMFTLPGIGVVIGIIIFAIVMTTISHWGMKIFGQDSFFRKLDLPQFKGEPGRLAKFIGRISRDDIPMSRTDLSRFWSHYAKANRWLGREREASAALEKATDLEEEILILKIAGIPRREDDRYRIGNPSSQSKTSSGPSPDVGSEPNATQGQVDSSSC